MSVDFGDKEYKYGVGYPTPYDIPDDTSCMTVPVPNNAAWQAVFTGLLLTLSQSEAWQQFEGAISQDDAAARWQAMVDEFLFTSMLGCNAVTPTGIRYFADDDAVQIQEPDGTWVDNPSADPRHSPSNEFPPIVSDNPQCDSATNIVAWIKAFIDTLNTITDEAGIIITFFTDVLEILWGAGIFLALITLFVETLISLGLNTIIDAFTDEVYAALACIFFCRLETDGMLTAAGLEHVNNDIDALIGGTAATVLHAMFFIMGEIGLSNVGSTGTETGDCSLCPDCGWCYEFDFTIDDGSFSAARLDAWTPVCSYVAGVGWVTPSNQTRGLGDNAVQMQIGRLLPDGHYTKVTVYGSVTWGANTVFANDLTLTFEFTPLTSITTGDDLPMEWTGTFDTSSTHVKVDGVIGYGATPPGGVCTITKIRFEGTGDNPFGDDNC